MADDQIVIIKKITNVGGHHGGAWKVAFADFMTAMMAFFLVMWLLNQSDAVKKQVASYFSGPSMLEHQLTTFGAKLTLEKLFLDFVNEPLGTLQKMMQPADFSPNVIAMGNQEIIVNQIAADIGMLAKNVNIQQDSVHFEIYDYMLFQVGEAKVSGQFVEVMEKIRKLSRGLEDAVLTIDSEIFVETVPSKKIEDAERVALQRAYILKKYLESAIESETVDIEIKTNVRKAEVLPPSGKPAGSILFSMQQKSTLSDGSHPKEISADKDYGVIKQSVYEDIVRRIEAQKKESQK